MYYNNEFIQELHLKPVSEGFQFGYGVFETILLTEGVPCFVEQHYERLTKSCAIMSIQLRLEKEALYEQAMKLGKILNITEGRLKITCFKDVDGDSYIMTLSPYNHQWDMSSQGVSITLSDIKRNPHSPLCYLKSLNYMENILGRNEAAAKGYDEALFLNVHDKVCEGAVSNIFWIKSGVINTPDISCGILSGVIRKQVLDICSKIKLSYEEGSYDMNEVLQADEVFITNSLKGIMPVYRVDHTFFKVSDYVFTKQIHQEYITYIKNDISKIKMTR